MKKMVAVTTRGSQPLEFLLWAFTAGDRGMHLQKLAERIDVMPSEQIERLTCPKMLSLVQDAEQGIMEEQRVSVQCSAEAWKLTWSCADGTNLCLSVADSPRHAHLTITGRLKNVIEHGKNVETFVPYWKGTLIQASGVLTPPLDGHDVCSAAIAAADLLFDD